MKRWLFIALVCYTLRDVQNAACEALCQRDGYTSGSATKTQGCACVDVKESLKNYVHRSMNLGPQPIAPFIPEAQTKSSSPTFKIEYPDNY